MTGDKKYYAKIKGWEFIETSSFFYWNLDLEEGGVWVSTDSPDSRFQPRLSLKEWNELGINDENADFEEVEKW